MTVSEKKPKKQMLPKFPFPQKLPNIPIEGNTIASLHQPVENMYKNISSICEDI